MRSQDLDRAIDMYFKAFDLQITIEIKLKKIEPKGWRAWFGRGKFEEVKKYESWLFHVMMLKNQATWYIKHTYLGGPMKFNSTESISWEDFILYTGYRL